jgi:hypothetical protein
VSITDQHLPIDSDAVPSGQHEVWPTPHVGFEEVTADFAQFEAPLEGSPVAACAATAVSNTGRSFPLGATVLGEGVNFSVFSREANRIDLLLFDDPAATRPARVIELDPRTHRTYHYWHICVPGIRSGQVYAYRADGPFAPAHGLRFDPAKVLLDPYGRAVIAPDGYSRQAASQYGEINAIAMKSVVVDPTCTIGRVTLRCAGPSPRP